MYFTYELIASTILKNGISRPITHIAKAIDANQKEARTVMRRLFKLDFTHPVNCREKMPAEMRPRLIANHGFTTSAVMAGSLDPKSEKIISYRAAFIGKQNNTIIQKITNEKPIQSSIVNSLGSFSISNNL